MASLAVRPLECECGGEFEFLGAYYVDAIGSQHRMADFIETYIKPPMFPKKPEFAMGMYLAVWCPSCQTQQCVSVLKPRAPGR